MSLKTKESQNLALFESMYLARCVDEKMEKLVKQNKGGTFQLSGAGHELVGVAFGQALKDQKNWAFPYYRDQAFVIGYGCELEELFGVFLGRQTENHSSGRMMPYHFSDKQRQIYCQSSVVGSQFLHAVGRALGIKNLHRDEVAYVSAGDGATSQGDFHEALNFAAIHALPVIFVIQDNEYAISVTQQEQTAGTIQKICEGYEGVKVYQIDGSDATQTVTIATQAVQEAKQGPVVVIAKVPRLQAHSNSDNPKKYLEEEQVEALKQRDPVALVEQRLIEEIGKDDVEALKQRLFNKVAKAALVAEKLPYPSKETAYTKVFAPHDMKVQEPTEFGEKIVIADALNRGLKEAMRVDEHVVVFGQDVAFGKGGVFGITQNLTEEFGAKRCFNTPLAESTIIGLAIGLSADGLHKPVVEIQFADYLWTGINQLFNEASSIYYRSDGQWPVPIVVRMPCGGYIQGGPYHSQSIEGFLTHCPGLKVVFPSHALDAKMLLKAAIEDPNPVIFLEHKGLYRQQAFSAKPEPLGNYSAVLGEAKVLKEGSDLTLVCFGMMAMMGMEAARQLALEGIHVEVIDLRTLVPLDMKTILTSVKKTGKVCVAQEGPLFGGFAAEIAAQIGEQAFESLDAPIARLGAFEAPVPYSKPLEQQVLPQLEDLIVKLRKLAQF